MTFFPFDEDAGGTFVGRIWLPQHNGPAIVTVRDGEVIDITSSEARWSPTSVR